MGLVTFILVVGALGFAVWLILAAFKRHEELLERQNQMLAHLLGVPAQSQPEPVVAPANWQIVNPPAQPVTQAVPTMEQQAAYWAQRG